MLHPLQGVLGYGVERGALPPAPPGVWGIAIQRRGGGTRVYVVWGMGNGVWGTALRARPEGTVFHRGALRARVIERNFFGACGGQSHLLGSTMINVEHSHYCYDMHMSSKDVPAYVFCLLALPLTADGRFLLAAGCCGKRLVEAPLPPSSSCPPSLSSSRNSVESRGS